MKGMMDSRCKRLLWFCHWAGVGRQGGTGPLEKEWRIWQPLEWNVPSLATTGMKCTETSSHILVKVFKMIASYHAVKMHTIIRNAWQDQIEFKLKICSMKTWPGKKGFCVCKHTGSVLVYTDRFYPAGHSCCFLCRHKYGLHSNWDLRHEGLKLANNDFPFSRKYESAFGLHGQAFTSRAFMRYIHVPC